MHRQVYKCEPFCETHDSPGLVVQAGSNAARQLPGAQEAASHQQRRNLVQPAEQERPLPQISVDRVGAISVIGENDPPHQPGVYRNIDGYREEDGRYARFTEEISHFIPSQRQFTDPVRTFAYGTDASFYRLNPRMVVKVCTLSLGCSAKCPASLAHPITL